VGYTWLIMALMRHRKWQRQDTQCYTAYILGAVLLLVLTIEVLVPSPSSIYKCMV
jgi:hypothetical protein